MTINERLKAPCSRFGKILKTWVAYTLLIAGGLDAGLELFDVVPPETIPVWLKTTIFVGALISRIAGNLTVATPPKEDE